MAADASGNVYVADCVNNRIQNVLFLEEESFITPKWAGFVCPGCRMVLCSSCLKGNPRVQCPNCGGIVSSANRDTLEMSGLM